MRASLTRKHTLLCDYTVWEFLKSIPLGEGEKVLRLWAQAEAGLDSSMLMKKRYGLISSLKSPCIVM